MISFGDSLIQGRLVRRYKRFLADVDLEGGERVTALCPNPGSMDTCMVEGGKVWLSHSDNPKRKLAHTWELSRVGEQLIVVNTARANQVVRGALERRAITELSGYTSVRPEVRVGDKSRLDFLLEGERPIYVEVKSVTMSGGREIAIFPSSVTTRGTRHLEELMELHRQGMRAVLLFCVQRTKVRLVRPADEIDPVYGAALRRAAKQGVEILAYGSAIGTRRIRIGRRLPVQLG